MQTDSKKTELEEIRTLFDPNVGHFADKSARWLFKKTENLHGLVKILASELAEHFDFTQTKVENRSFVDDTLRDLVSDMVFTVPYQDETLEGDLTIYILIEHQSTVDHLMGFRLLSYMCQIWRRQLEEQIVPTYEILLYGVKGTNFAKVTEVDHSFEVLMMVLRQENADATSIQETMAAALDRLETLASENPELHKHALLYLYYLVFFKRPEKEQEHLRQLLQTYTHDKEVENIIMTGAEALIQKGINQGLQQGIEQGIEQGEIQTKREILLRLLDIRIGEVPDTITRKVSRMRSRSRLDALLEQAATAQTLDDIEWKQ